MRRQEKWKVLKHRYRNLARDGGVIARLKRLWRSVWW